MANDEHITHDLIREWPEIRGLQIVAWETAEHPRNVSVGLVVDFDAKLIRVRHNLIYDDTLKGPKTKAGNRDVPMPRHVAELLRDWLEVYYVRDKRTLIFRTPVGTIVSNMNFGRRWKDLLKRAGLYHAEDGFHFHAFRHFCASWMIENGESVMEVAAMLGHSKFDMTLQVYAHPVRAKHARHDMIETMVRRMPVPALALQSPSARRECDFTV